MGLSVGTETYYKYLQSFGLMDKTGIDMIGEVQGIFQDEKTFNSQVVSLASYSFGQTFNVTPHRADPGAGRLCQRRLPL